MIHPKHIPEKCCQNALSCYLFIERFLLCGAHKLLCHFHGNHELLMRKPRTLGSHAKIKSNLEQGYRTDVRTFSGDEWFRGLFLFCLCTFIFTSSQVLVGLAPESKGTYTGSLAWGLATDSRHNRLEICLWFICGGLGLSSIHVSPALGPSPYPHSASLTLSGWLGALLPSGVLWFISSPLNEFFPVSSANFSFPLSQSFLPKVNLFLTMLSVTP